jgi:hypothetical protein
MGKKVMTPFKMSPKQAGMIESIRKENPKAAKKIEAGIKEADKKNKEDVDGAMLMDNKYAAMMGGYGKEPIKLDTGAGKKKNPNRSDVKNKKEGIDVSSPKIRKMYDKYKASGGKLSINQAARIGFASPSESKRRMTQANVPGGRGKDGLKDI